VEKAEEIRKGIAGELAAAIAFAEQSPLPEASEILEDVYA
jgi:TPP-dependent pyruvate/acetoin dehydrogenase alpha subunit